MGSRIGQGLARPFIQRIEQDTQRSIDVQNEAQRQHILKRARQQPDPVKRQKLFEIVRNVQSPNMARELSPALTADNAWRDLGKDALTLGSFAIPALRVPGAIAKASPLIRLAGSGAIRGLENAAFEGGRQIIDQKFDPRALLNAGLMGAAANTAFSPKLAWDAKKQVFTRIASDNAAEIARRTDPVTGMTKLQMRGAAQPGFAKLPGGERKAFDRAWEETQLTPEQIAAYRSAKPPEPPPRGSNKKFLNEFAEEVKRDRSLEALKNEARKYKSAEDFGKKILDDASPWDNSRKYKFYDYQIEKRRVDDIAPLFDPNAHDIGTIKEYTDSIKKGDKFPLVTLDKDGQIINGFHRLHAYKAAGVKDIPVLVAKKENQYSAPRITNLTDLYNEARGVTNKLPRKELTGKALSTPEKVLRKNNTEELAEALGMSKQDMTPTTPPGGEVKLKIKPKSQEAPVITREDGTFDTNIALAKADEKKEFKGIINRFVGGKEARATEGAQAAFRNKNIPAKQAKETIQALAGKTAPNQYSKQLRAEFDATRKAGTEAGVDIGYLYNYVTQIWKETPEQVAKAFQSAGQTFKFSKERVIPSYEEGIKLGLTPKYTNPADILGHYTQKLGEVQENIKFVKELKENGYLVPASVGRNTPGFAPINAMGISKNETSIDGKTFIGDWYAPADVAGVINNLFNPKEANKVLDWAARQSGGIQNLMLSGGIPKSPLNFFTLSQGIKDITAGRTIPFIESFFTSFSKNKTLQTFNQKAHLIKEMQQQGVPFRSSFKLGEITDRGTFKNLFGETGGEAWEKITGEPTFGRFMPLQQLKFYEDVKNKLLKKGKSSDEAIKIASTAAKNWFGLTDVADTATRSANTQAAIKTFLFAPRYRESMINFWTKSFIGLKNPLAPENIANTRFLAGAILTYMAYDQMNKKMFGRPLSENPEGREMTLLIPLGDGHTMGVPILPSVGYIPRTLFSMGKAAISGDFKEATRQARGVLSAGVKPISDVFANENYFGQEIYDEEGTTGEKFKEIGNYLGNPITGAYGHPYIRESVKYAQGKQPGYQAASKALELPLRYYKDENLKLSDLYANAKKAGQGKGTSDNGILERENGSFAFQIGDQVRYADTRKEAELEIAKDKFKKSDKVIQTVGDMVLRRTKDGGVSTISKLDYDENLNYRKLNLAYDQRDMKKWTDLAKKQLGFYEKQLEDPTLDELEKLEIEDRYITLAKRMQKYASYGGSFTKGRKGRKAKAQKLIQVSGSPSTSAEISIGGTPKFSTPKIASSSPAKAKAIKLVSGLTAKAPKGRGLQAVRGRGIKLA